MVTFLAVPMQTFANFNNDIPMGIIDEEREDDETAPPSLEENRNVVVADVHFHNNAEKSITENILSSSSGGCNSFLSNQSFPKIQKVSVSTKM